MSVKAELRKHFDSMFTLILENHTHGPVEFLELVVSFLSRTTDFFKSNEEWRDSKIKKMFNKYTHNETMKRKLQEQEVETTVQPAKQYKQDLPKPKSQKPETPTIQTNKEQITPSRHHQFLYDSFMTWKKDRELNEDLLLEYFEHMRRFHKPPELLALTKSLKIIFAEKGLVVHVPTITRVADVIKSPQLSLGAFSYLQVNEFLQRAPNKKYLLDKVILIIGITGGCSVVKMMRLKLTDVKEVPNGYEITIRKSQLKVGGNAIDHKYIIYGDAYCQYIREYIKLRQPHDVPGDPFIIHYKDGICVNIMATNTTFGYRIATFLSIINPLQYVSNDCFIATYRSYKQYFYDKGICKVSEDSDNTESGTLNNALPMTNINAKEEQLDAKNEVWVKEEVVEEVTSDEDDVTCG